MANALDVASIVAKETLLLIDNNVEVMNSFWRDHEAEFGQKVNGYNIGDTISIRRPVDFTVTTGNVATPQDIVDNNMTLKVDQQLNVAFKLSSVEMTLKFTDSKGIDGLRERVCKPLATNIVNTMMTDLFSVYKNATYNSVGTMGTAIANFSKFSAGPQRLDEMAVPPDSRYAALSPADFWAMTGTQTGLFIDDVAKSAYRQGKLGNIGAVDTYMSQVVPTHTVGPLGGSPAVNGAGQNVTYASLNNVWQSNLITNGWTAAAAVRLNAGDIFTIANVYSVNPKTKAVNTTLQQFTVVGTPGQTFSSDGAGNLTIAVSPPIITSGPHQTVNSVPANTAAITVQGSANSSAKTNLVYHKNAFALAIVPMVIPPGSIGFARESYKNVSLRIGPYFDGTNDVSNWRADLLYGRAAIDPRLATRLGG